ncbi:unnamed protein product [Staurois parvus]|uniref:Uncharacterized protein n=1 Tax=Staurois parvus TaxID=386267 RepID=A0ABN9D8H3_9NEOB|nr:unnamed protein product [Staurois parvus]
MALGRKGPYPEMQNHVYIKGLTVFMSVLLGGGVCVLHCNHTALDGCAVHSHPEQCTRADREENC